MRVVPESLKDAMDLGLAPCVICTMQTASYSSQSVSSCRDTCAIYAEWIQGKHPASKVCVICGTGLGG